MVPDPLILSEFEIQLQRKKPSNITHTYSDYIKKESSSDANFNKSKFRNIFVGEYTNIGCSHLATKALLVASRCW